MGNATGRFSLSPRTSSFNQKKNPKRKKMKHGKQLLAAPFTNDCNSLESSNNDLNECESVRRLIMVLGWYKKMRSDMNMDKLLFEYVDSYPNLLNDYHHVLTKHLNKNKATNDVNFFFIHNELSKRIQCDVRTCKQFTRLNIPDRLSRISNANIDELQTMIGQDTDIVHFYKELLDVLHCYFMHSYDLGLRVSIFDEERIEMSNDDDKEEEEEGVKLLKQDIIERKDESMIDLEHKQEEQYIETLHNDEEIRSLEKSLRRKRDTLKIMRGLSLNENSKFFADISIGEHEDDTLDTHTHAVEEYKYEYGFGNRYYYWPFYKDNDQYKHLYIEHKYGNLKEEVMDNTIFRVQMNDYDRTYDKATHYLTKSDIIKDMRSSTLSYGNCHYDINSDEILRIEHIMSIMLYTDHQHLALAFARSFRKYDVKQSDEEYKKEKREYANWKRFIRETVELYGTTMEDNEIKSFYFGISSHIVFNRFIEKMCCPVSTSPQISAIMMFGRSDNGIILDLGQSSQPGNRLKCFNCSLLSCYGEEDERLFIGGYAPIQINSIRIVKTHKNYQRFLGPLGYFDTILNGAYDINNKCCTADFEIIKSLIHELRDDITVINHEDEVKQECECISFPLYISKMFGEFVVRKENIYIDLQGLHWHYKAFISLLISSVCNNLVRFSFIATLFNKCRNITVKMLMYDSVSKSYIAQFLEDIERINALKSKRALETIRLEMFRINVNQTKWKEFELALNALNCSLELTGRGNEGYKELLIVFNK